ncbi:hypothetical protein [Pararhizobium haloflavum]|uniref:hypothetical protein n=1 Tax=Pararhizobium haloflavum TaxID=2037914 RepID=UPI0013000181|nr:hypothetical protein [Pararhizobium haloflavum]
MGIPSAPPPLLPEDPELRKKAQDAMKRQRDFQSRGGVDQPGGFGGLMSFLLLAALSSEE